MSSINRVVSVHETAPIKVYSDEKDATTEPPVGRRRVSPNVKHDVLEKLRTPMKPYFYSKPKVTLVTLDFVPLCDLAHGDKTITEFHQHDVDWLRLDMVSADPVWCNWSGYQATVVNMEQGNGNNRVSYIQYMPLINESPTDWTTLHTGLQRFVTDTERQPVIVTFDYPLYIKAVEIGLSLDLPILVRIGGMMKSFLGSIGCLMKGNGLEAIISIAYPGEGTVELNLKGSAYYKSLKSHFLIIKALLTGSREDCDTVSSEEMRKCGRMSALWVMYIVMIVFAFIRVEKTSNFELHLQAARSMLPYFVSAGHHQYAKGTRL